jgi:uncharacterized protein involved in type VI secretion and phage assembly
MSVFGPPPREDGDGPRWYGLYPAQVLDLVDPQNLGRVLLGFPSLGPEARNWATLLTPYADDDQGLMVLPEVGSQVVAAFEAGDPTRPYVVGACWNGRRALPEPVEAANNLRTLKTRSGSRLQFDDREGAARITLGTRGGHELVIDEGAQQVTLSHPNGCRLVIDIGGNVSIDANVRLTITASMVEINAPMTRCSGVVQCDTLITNSVVSPSYTPGAGNIW